MKYDFGDEDGPFSHLSLEIEDPLTWGAPEALAPVVF
jgi:hypothetical protein